MRLDVLRTLGIAHLLAATAACTLAMGCVAAAGDEGDEQEIDGPEPVGDRGEGVSPGDVEHAISSTCSTSSVKGLSQQIIEEGNCISPGAYVKVPDLGNVSFGASVFPYLEKPAQEALVSALKANPGKQMTVNSMLRTIAQQYMLHRWSKSGSCGIGLAATPGNSNHETGLALDINQFSTWKSPLQARGFRWFGSADQVHFDFVGSGAVSYKGLDVKAFQRLWNRNHPSDKISADGDWGPQTEARMKKAPAAGFAKGATCDDSAPAPTGGVSAASWASGRLDLFARDADDHLAHRWYSGDWSGWEDLGGKLTSDPVAVSWDSGRIDVFARGGDNHLVHTWWKSGSGWSGWEDLGGDLASSPAVASWASGRLDVFARGGDDDLVHKYFRSGEGWSGWEHLEGPLTSRPAVVSWGEGRIDVVARGGDDELVHRHFESGAGWSGWEDLGGTLTSTPAVASWGEGHLDVFARGGGDDLVHKSFESGAGWSGWEHLGGTLRSTPGAVSWADGRIDVFARGESGALVHRWFTGGDWSDWQKLGTLP
jgi:hypothetical protein